MATGVGERRYMLQKAKKKARGKSGRCKVVRTPSGIRYMKNGRFVKRSEC